MTVARRYWAALLFTASAFAAVAFYYGDLPERVPVHWSLYGSVDAWLPRRVGSLAIPSIALTLTGLSIVFEPADARSGSSSMRWMYPTVVAAVAAFLLYMTIMMVSVGVDTTLSLQSHSLIGLGVLLIVIGNGAGKITRNHIVGIRTPWTLASDEIWARTHRIGGWLLVPAGLVAAVAGLAGQGTAFAASAVIAAVIVPVVYSYVLARRLRGDRPNARK